MAEDGPTVVRLTMEAGLRIVGMTTVADPVMANASSMVVRLAMKAS